MAQVIEKESSIFGSRFAYYDPSSDELDFSPGTRVLPAELYSLPNSSHIEFVREHRPGTPGWKDGGYECRETDPRNPGLSKFRAFMFDALIVHPSVLKERRKANKKHPQENGDTTISSTQETFEVPEEDS